MEYCPTAVAEYIIQLLQCGRLHAVQVAMRSMTSLRVRSVSKLRMLEGLVRFQMHHDGLQ